MSVFEFKVHKEFFHTHQSDERLNGCKCFFFFLFFKPLTSTLALLDAA